jgi:hypothetical protein
LRGTSAAIAALLVTVAPLSAAYAAPTERASSRLQAANPMLLVVSLASQRMVVYGPDGSITTTRVSTGQPGHRTPTGVFSVIQKNRYHTSNIYSGAPMPFMQRITWSGIALHAGVVPNYPASHGCIRLPYDFASELFGATKMNVRVVITPSDVEARSFTHAALPVPTMTPPDATGPAVAAEGTLIKVAAAGSPSSAPLLNPVQRAQAARAQAVTRQQEAGKRAKALLEEARLKSDEANDARTDLAAAEEDFEAAQAVLAKAKTARELAKSEPEIERAQAALDKATAALTATADALAQAILEETPKRSEAFAAAAASKAADAEVETATRDAALAAKAVEPMSVFFSRKEGKVFVRQGWTQMYEAPVTFRDPDRPLGTHTFVAVAAEPATPSLSWLAVSHPEGASDEDRAPVRRQRGEQIVTGSTARSDASTAADALDRIEMSAETKAYIADRAWVGASIIVSDFGLSGETGQYTDFIVLTK